MATCVTRGNHSVLTVDDMVEYRDGALCSLRGVAEYSAAAKAWPMQLLEECPDAVCTIVRAALIGPGEVVVRYNVTWVPPTAKWLEALALSLPGVRVERRDQLHRVSERSVFRWAAVWRALLRLVTEGVVTVPLAVLSGTCRLSLGADGSGGWRLLRQVETLDLWSSLRQGELLNRQLATDLLLFLEIRNPPGTSAEAWADEVRVRSGIESVPGMGQFDVDGLDPSDQQDLLAGGTAALGYLTLCCIAVAGLVGSLYFERMLERQTMEATLQLLL